MGIPHDWSTGRRVVNDDGLLVEYPPATDYEVAEAALAGWRVVYDDRGRIATDHLVLYKYVVVAPSGTALNRYVTEREAWKAAHELLRVEFNEEGDYRGGNKVEA